jgi:G6PDH family F420-dependent oxidoreductase
MTRVMRIGYVLSSEEFGPHELVRQARLAEEAGFQGLWISDHFHPWNDEQGHSPLVWTVIGAIAQATSRIKLMTAVTCPTVRIHPAIVAQAAATSAVLLEGRFALGLGSGEALNEHILGDRWPSVDQRLEMLEEAVNVIRTLWQGGMRTHRGRHYTVENARIYDIPNPLPPIIISGFGPKSTALAAGIGDGFCTTFPDGDAAESFRADAGTGKPVLGGMKVCWDQREDRARATAHRLWPTEALPGELAQVLPTPAHFEQACSLVTEEMVTDRVPCGPDLERHIEAIEHYAEAGFDELYIGQIGDGHEDFFKLYEREILPRFRNGDRRASIDGEWTGSDAGRPDPKE